MFCKIDIIWILLKSWFRLIRFSSFQWSVHEAPPGFEKPDKLTFGLLLDGEYSSNVLDRGPSADSQEVGFTLIVPGKQTFRLQD